MRLKKLEVFGFKSFFEKTVITFQPGITAVVGPNGCGKSNLADAILWVLGEQSPKSLRGEKMDDVIFNGTELRKPLGMAEVSLTFGDIDNELPPPYSPYAEITVSRRLFRSGESEYLINKTICRLKDIRELLIDTGAGYRAHTIIEQGKVDDMISATPLQRREIVEEAAGIAKYRIRKAEALRKLEATEQNLTRVRDIIGEIKRQINSLDRQARKAEKYKNLKEELRTLELQVASTEWHAWNGTREGLAQEEARLQEKTTRQETELATLDLQQAEIKLSLAQKEQEMGEIKKQVFETEGKIQRLESKIEMLHAQRKEWNETRFRTDQEIGEIRQTGSNLETEREGLAQELGEIGRILPEKEALLSDRQEEVNQLERQLAEQTTSLEQGRAALFDLISRLTQLRNNLSHIQTRKEELRRKKEREILEQGELQRKMSESGERLQILKERWEGAKGQLVEKGAAHTAAVSLLKETEAAIKAKWARLSEVKEASAALSAKSAAREGFYRGLLGKQEGSENALLQLDGLQGMVADLVEVPPDYEKAIEAVLESRLRGIVVENHTEIKKGVDHLRHAQAGRGTFFPRLPRQLRRTGEQGGSGPVGAPAAIEGAGIIGRALDLISSRPGYEAIAALLLSEVVVVSDLEAAFRLWEQFPQVGVWVTLQGDVIDSSGIVSGGERGETGLLEQKREIKSLTDQLSRLQEEMRQLEAEIEHHQQVQQTTRSEIETLTTEIRALEMQQLHEQKDHGALLADMDRLQNGLQTLLFEQEEGTQEEEVLARSEQAEQNQLSELGRLKEEKEEALGRHQGTLNEIRQALEVLREEVIRLKMETASLKEKQRHLLEKQERTSQTQRELAQRLQEKERLIASLQEKLAFGETEEVEVVSAIQQHAGERENLISLIREMTEAHGMILAGLKEVEQKTQQLRTGLDQTKKEAQEKALRKIEAEMMQRKIQETVLMNYQIEIAAHPLSQGELPLDEAREKAPALRRSLEEMGPVNMGAIEEYRELETRYQFLTGQETDLTTSMESLRQVITKINKTTQGLFVDTFHTLNRKFGEVFVSFFGGGKAELTLVDPDQPLESGIEMLAQPPGKRPRSITLLSGGEKALTAISLLFATFLIHPSPFCLLDEIDAPLDEENTRRFTQALTSMSRQTQFIIVTHNKRSMEIADVLYGVTMEETGLSKLVSVRLNESRQANGHPLELPVASDSA